MVNIKAVISLQYEFGLFSHSLIISFSSKYSKQRINFKLALVTF